MPAFAIAAKPPADAALEHVNVSLVAESSALVPGTAAWVGLRLRHEAHWHTYWVNPGDAGLPTKLAWQLPPGYRAGEIAWPAPKRFDVGGLYNFGYDGEVLLPVRIDVPADAKPGSRAKFAVEAKWLVCHEECVPGKTALAITLPVAAHATKNPRFASLFATSFALAPQPATWTGVATLAGDRVIVELDGAGLPATAALQVFPVQPRVVGYAPPRTEARDDALVLIFAKSDYYTSPPQTFDLVLRPDDLHAFGVAVPFHADPSAASNR
ncbi:MAG TPA: protein-disulfide reductase DsbD domain-containing protein [Rudaea sp.]|nr:protein-disulfide reductase DsbD domain-containing protein [Rudaea sp.]